jgi:hypothetical protein
MLTMACASIGAVGTMRMLGQALAGSVASIVSVTTSDFRTSP